MEITTTTKVKKCDFCDSTESVYDECLGCGKDICYECRKLEAVTYPHAMHFSGSDDGTYCHKCDKKLDDDPLHKAYKAIGDLRKEAGDFNKDIHLRSERAEMLLKSLLREPRISLVMPERGE